jgi:hypothetical protein
LVNTSRSADSFISIFICMDERPNGFKNSEFVYQCCD